MPERTGLSRLLPKTVASRVYLILFLGLLFAHALSFGLLFYERYTAARAMLLSNVEQDVQLVVALLDRLPAQERESWLPHLRRRTYHYILGEGDIKGLGAGELVGARSQQMTRMIADVLGDRYPLRANTTSLDPERFQVHLRLSDGSPLTIELEPSVMPIAKWLPIVLGAQVALLLVVTWLAARSTTRPLARLASAAETLNPTTPGPRLQEGGPSEVAHAVAAFNAMQDRISQHLRERMQILAAISHDLQTPITRMKLRADDVEEQTTREKMLDDLGEMEHLVREGVAYARSAHGASEPAVNVDLNAFLDSIVYDYQDIGKQVTRAGSVDNPVSTRPHALRRVITNLIDNAIKYAGGGELTVRDDATGRIFISVLDRGPGIPVDRLDAVMQPFVRLESSRSRETGGAGLGLAIAQQLAVALGGTLTLCNRDGGGLEATLTLPRAD
jgi:signal transduction histidine kinase